MKSNGISIVKSTQVKTTLNIFRYEVDFLCVMLVYVYFSLNKNIYATIENLFAYSV